MYIYIHTHIHVFFLFPISHACYVCFPVQFQPPIDLLGNPQEDATDKQLLHACCCIEVAHSMDIYNIYGYIYCRIAYVIKLFMEEEED